MEKKHEFDNLSKEELFRYSSYQKPNENQVYILSEELKDAVKVAIMLQQPLLITGEPGTGKTALAYKVAAELHRISEGLYREQPYYFATKSNSQASDLFYTYDAISHFFDANIARGIAPALNDKIDNQGTWRYITLQAFGKAIVATLSPDKKSMMQAINASEINSTSARNAVVLIDEIDKASRDFPNDILNEIERYQFSIKETGFTTFAKDPEAQILLIMTSNSEKALPEPFLRRCVFYHIDFPSTEQLIAIVSAHKPFFHEPASDALIRWACDQFSELREYCREKKPATAELISWIRCLAENGFDPQKPDKSKLRHSLTTVIKNTDDRMRVLELDWIK